MATIRTFAALCLTFSLLGVTACTPHNPTPTNTLRVGHVTLDGTVHTWPARGSLAQDTAVAEEIRVVVDAWRTPRGDRPRMSTSAIVWLGDIDGSILGLVAADIPGSSESWLLQITGTRGALTVSRNTPSADPGALVYADVLPVRGPQHTRYLTSARVHHLTVNGAIIPVTDGLSDPVAIPACAPTVITATRIATRTLGHSGSTIRLIDLGADVPATQYPLIVDQSGTASAVFATVPPCRFTAAEGPFIRARISPAVTPHDPEHVSVVPWPVKDLQWRSGSHNIPVPGITGTLQIVDWQGSSGPVSAALWQGPHKFSLSLADRMQPLQFFTLTVDNRQLLVVTWDIASGEEPLLPTGTPVLLSRPGLAVIEQPTPGTQLSIAVPGTAKPFVRIVS